MVHEYILLSQVYKSTIANFNTHAGDEDTRCTSCCPWLIISIILMLIFVLVACTQCMCCPRYCNLCQTAKGYISNIRSQIVAWFVFLEKIYRKKVKCARS